MLTNQLDCTFMHLMAYNLAWISYGLGVYDIFDYRRYIAIAWKNP